jgi:hypothetical protein
MKHDDFLLWIYEAVEVGFSTRFRQINDLCSTIVVNQIDLFLISEFCEAARRFNGFETVVSPKYVFGLGA